MALSVFGSRRSDGQQIRRLRFSTAFGKPIHDARGTGLFNLLMEEAGRRAGFVAEIDAPPAERALFNANTGVVDGDGPRIDDLAEIGAYPNLLRVPVVLLEVDFVAFSIDVAPVIRGWSDLALLNVGIVRGWKILEHKILAARSLVRTKTASLLFNMLKNQRIDVAVIDRHSGLAAAHESGIGALRIGPQPLARRPMYLHLHKKHADLIGPLSKALQSMQDDGTSDRIKRQVLGDLMTLVPPMAEP